MRAIVVFVLSKNSRKTRFKLKTQATHRQFYIRYSVNANRHVEFLLNKKCTLMSGSHELSYIAIALPEKS